MMKKYLASLIWVIVLCLFTGCSNVDKEELIISYDDSVNSYVISLYQVGEPRGAFGDVNAKLILTDTDGNVINEKAFALANDGADVRGSNITEVNWYDDRVEVALKELDTDNEFVYILNYE